MAPQLGALREAGRVELQSFLVEPSHRQPEVLCLAFGRSDDRDPLPLERRVEGGVAVGADRNRAADVVREIEGHALALAIEEEGARLTRHLEAASNIRIAAPCRFQIGADGEQTITGLVGRQIVAAAERRRHLAIELEGQLRTVQFRRQVEHRRAIAHRRPQGAAELAIVPHLGGRPAQDPLCRLFDARLPVGCRQKPLGQIVERTELLFLDQVHRSQLRFAVQSEQEESVATRRQTAALASRHTYLEPGPRVHEIGGNVVAQPACLDQEMSRVVGGPLVRFGPAGPGGESAIGDLESPQPFDPPVDVGIDPAGCLGWVVVLVGQEVLQVELRKDRRHRLFHAAVGIADQTFQSVSKADTGDWRNPHLGTARSCETHLGDRELGLFSGRDRQLLGAVHHRVDGAYCELDLGPTPRFSGRCGDAYLGNAGSLGGGEIEAELSLALCVEL